MNEVTLSVLVINLNGGDILPACLRAIAGGLTGPGDEVIVVDNGSTDGSPDRVALDFPSVRILRNSRNEGFATAVNQGIRASRGRYIAVINSDARPEPQALSSLVSFMKRTPRCVMAGAQLVNPDGTPQHSFDQIPSLTTELFGKSLLRRFFPGRFPSKRQVRGEPFEVESIVGAAMVLLREFLEQMGSFDERFFVFLEETDLSLRVRQGGWAVFVVPEARVVHLQGATKSRTPARGRVEYLKSLHQFFMKHYGYGSYLGLRLGGVIKSLVNALCSSVPFILSAGLVRSWRQRGMVTAYVMLWHLLLCPSWMGISRGRRRSRTELRGRTLWMVDHDLTHEEEQSVIENYDAMIRNARVVKDIRIKQTLEYPMNGKTILVKRYKRRGWLDGLKVPRAMHEMAVAQRIVSRGIETIVPMACVSNGSGSALIREKFMDWAPMDALLTSADLGASDRKILLQSYGRFARRIHEAGVFQYDFDPNNILVQKNGGRFDLLLIDFEKTTVRGHLSIDLRLWILAKMNRIRKGITRADRLRFLKAYLSTHQNEERGWKAMVGKIHGYSMQIRVRDDRRLEKNCISENRNFGCFTLGDFSGYYRKRREEAGRDGVTHQEVLDFLTSGRESQRWHKVASSHVRQEWQKAHVAARSGGPVPYMAVARKGAGSGHVFYREPLTKSVPFS